MSQNEHVTGAQKTWREKVGLAEMLKGGVIMDVTTADQAKIAEDAGAVAVMALERVPADIRRDGGVARMSDPEMILAIKETVTILPTRRTTSTSTCSPFLSSVARATSAKHCGVAARAPL